MLRVVAKTMLSDDVCGLTLAAVDGGRLPDWTPGSYLDLLLPGGVTRQYSLCGDRRDAYTYSIAVLRERGASAYVHDQLREGDVVGFAGPRNNFPLVPATRYEFVAGGIGITPILPMIRAAEVLGTPWTLLYVGRRRASMAFVSALSEYGDRVRIRPRDSSARPLLPTVVEPGAKVYCCGPASMIAALDGLPAGSLRVERFVPLAQGAPVRSTPFEVALARSGVSVRVDPGVSVLSAMAAAGVPVLSSCRQGVCGTCETPVIEGVPDHRDSLLSGAERAAGQSMFVCVSRSCGDRLVLDA